MIWDYALGIFIGLAFCVVVLVVTILLSWTRQ